MTETYTVAVVLRRRPWYQRLLSRFVSAWSRPLFVHVRPVCPKCGEATTGQRARIIAGPVYTRGLASWQGPDRIVGFTLEPCGHRVERFATTSAFETPA